MKKSSKKGLKIAAITVGCIALAVAARIPFDYTEEYLEEARKWERIVNDDVQDTGGEETCMVN